MKLIAWAAALLLAAVTLVIIGAPPLLPLGLIVGVALLMRDRLLLAFAFIVMCAVAITPALADTAVVAATTSVPANTDTTVTLPFGAWINAIAPTVIEIAGAVLTVILAWAARLLPATLRSFISDAAMKQAEQLLERAVDYGINAVAGAAKDKTLTIDVGNQVIAQAANYVVTHGPAWLIDWMGGAAAIEQKIIARLPLEEAAKVAPVISAGVAVATGGAGPLVGSP